MKIGLGLYRQQLTDANFRFARQAGCTHVVAHLVNYFAADDPKIASDAQEGWGRAGDDALWQEDALHDLVRRAGAQGLSIAAIENFDPAHWSDILLGGAKRGEQVEHIKELIRRVGRAGIPCIGYCFSPAGVWGWTRAHYARGGAVSVGFDADQINPSDPIPDGMVWNMRIREGQPGAFVPAADGAAMRERLQWFLERVLPVAEQAGVTLAMHPEDPPVPSLRGIARQFYQPERLARLAEFGASPANQVELCLGTVQEMNGRMETLQLLEDLLQQKRVGYIHFRNVVGKAPQYREVFVDEGDLDMARVVSLLHQYDYQGVIVPDHTPELECPATWHAGMAYALGYIRALTQAAAAGRLQTGAN